MNLALADARVLVTGSSRGIGLGIAETFLAEGARVAITGRTRATLDASAEGLRTRFGAGRVVAIEGDFVSDDAELVRALKLAHGDLGGFDVVVANVGSGRGASGLDADGAEWERMVQVNLLGAARLAHHSVPMMNADGSLIFVASIAGMECLPAPLPYSAAKAGLIALAANLARQLAPRGIRVNTVSPGNVLHPGGSWEARRDRDPAGTDAYVQAEVPMGRFGTPLEIGAAVAFLASTAAAGFITGVNLVVDGGQSRSF